jgi:hypothetical protein
VSPPEGLRAAAALALAVAGAAGPWACSFFQELDSKPSPETDSDGQEDGATGTESCDLEDEDCPGQDLLRTCDPERQAATTWECPTLCGNFLNFTCTGGIEWHACWCVAPGKQKVYSCTELESCLDGCDAAGSTPCTDGCFARTTATTIRLLGSLVFCAESACRDTCRHAPAACADCRGRAGAGLSGGCEVERAVCDADRSDEAWPYPATSA